MNGIDVVLIFPEAGVGGRLFPAELAGFLNDYYGQKGVEVLPGQRAVGLEERRAASS